MHCCIWLQAVRAVAGSIVPHYDLVYHWTMIASAALIAVFALLLIFYRTNKVAKIILACFMLYSGLFCGAIVAISLTGPLRPLFTIYMAALCILNLFAGVALFRYKVRSKGAPTEVEQAPNS